jgi:hypothetical protein
VESDKLQPALDFFRATPRDLLDHPPLASSLQSLETCLWLIGLRRFPSAVVVCVNALESAIKAKLAIGAQGDKRNLNALITEVRSRFPDLEAFDQSKLDTLRRKRNDLVHYGFSPKDDRECCVLLLESGLPFLDSCYKAFFDFYLDWRDIRPDTKNFEGLSIAEAGKSGLTLEFANHLRYVKIIYQLSKNNGDFDPRLCFKAFIHFLRVHLKESAKSASEFELFKHADAYGLRFDVENRMKEELKRQFGESWTFDCPICESFEGIVAELDDRTMSREDVTTLRCACLQCGAVRAIK